MIQWPVASKWVDTTEDVKNEAAISQYRLGLSSSVMFKYVLDFTNLRSYNYQFYDESGDDYNVNAVTVGDHYFRYNSDAPTIIRVSGD